MRDITEASPRGGLEGGLKNGGTPLLGCLHFFMNQNLAIPV